MGNFCGCNDQNQNQENEQKESGLTSVYNITLKYIIYILLFLIKVIV